jgi:hypothetical protein
MKNILIILTALAVSAHATPITGSVSFTGNVKLDTSNPATANAVITWSNTKVQDADGAFGAFLATGDTATFTAPWTFDPSTLTLPLWTAGGFTFDLASSTINAQFAAGPLKFLNVSGTGTVTGHGYDSTPGNWAFTTQSPSSEGRFSFSSATKAVPDNGGTVALLGMAMVAIGLFKRTL